MPKKIQFHLLLADLALQLGDAPPGRRQILHPPPLATDSAPAPQSLCAAGTPDAAPPPALPKMPAHVNTARSEPVAPAKAADPSPASTRFTAEPRTPG